MPLSPNSQAKLGDMERRLVVELEPIGSSPHQKAIIAMVERHLVGLVNALKQVDSHLEGRVVSGMRQYLDEYEHEKEKEKERVEKKSSERKKGSAKGKE